MGERLRSEPAKRFTMDDLKPGDVVVVPVPRFSSANSFGGSRSFQPRGVRVAELYDRFFVAIVRRGESLVKESFRYEDVIDLNPAGIEMPVLRPAEEEHQPNGVGRGEAAELTRRRRILEEDAKEAFRLKQEGTTIAEIASKFRVSYNRAQAMVEKGKRLARKETLEPAPAPERAELEGGMQQVAQGSGAPVEAAADEPRRQGDLQARVEYLEQRVSYLSRKLEVLQQAFSGHVHLSDGRAVIVQEIGEVVGR